MIIVDFDVGAVGAEVEQPVEEDPEPGEPKGHALADVCLELGYQMRTLPVVIVEA